MATGAYHRLTRESTRQTNAMKPCRQDNPRHARKSRSRFTASVATSSPVRRGFERAFLRILRIFAAFLAPFSLFPPVKPLGSPRFGTLRHASRFPFSSTLPSSRQRTPLDTRHQPVASFLNFRALWRG